MCSWRRARVEATVLSTLKRSHFWLFRGSCGLTPWRRCQPGSGATRSESVFPTKREGPARGRRRHAMVAEALVPPGAARVAIRIATRVATVYTNAPKRPRGAISTDLCTLLRRRPGGEAHVAGVVTQPPTHTSSRSRQKVSSNLSCRSSRVPPRFTPTALDHAQLLPRPLRQTSRLGMRPSNRRPHPDCRLAPSALAPCVPQSALRLASSLSVEVAPCQN